MCYWFIRATMISLRVRGFSLGGLWIRIGSIWVVIVLMFWFVIKLGYFFEL